MDLYQKRIFAGLCIGSAIAAAAAAQVPAPDGPARTGTYTTVAGTISQLNYDREAEVNGFLLDNKNLVHLPPRAGAHIGSLVHAGDAVQISGVAETLPGGLQVIEAQNFQDRTSGKTFAMPAPGAGAPFTGSGRIKQLNYGHDGSIDGFWLENGNLATIPPFSSGNPSSIQTGATVAFSGYAHNVVGGQTVIDVQTISVNGQSLNLRMAGPPMPPPPPPPVGRTGQPPMPIPPQS